MIGIGCLEKLLEVISGLQRLALEVALGSSDELLLTFRMQLRKRTELSIYHFTGNIFQVSYLYFPKRRRISIMSKTNTGSNFI
jgi:hypothetical protein